MILDAEDYFVAQQAERKTREIRKRWQNRLVTLTVGKYKGYDGVVTDVTLDANDGRWLFLVMVIRKDGTDTLNSDAETRTYRPLWHFEVQAERWSPTSRPAHNDSLHDIWFGGSNDV